MIRIEAIEIEKFRGIRELTLHLDRENFGICGPNGTGKSGIVDAIEFVLTGDVSRLSGPGTGGLSVKKHAPHVKERDDPRQARVRLRAYVPSLGKSMTIERTVANAANYSVDPDEPDIKAVIEEIQTHPEFALSRREIIRYILAEPNKRSTDVQALLRLSEVEETRRALTTVANNASRERDGKQQSLTKAEKELLQTLTIDELKPALILKTLNAARIGLSLAPLERLDARTSLKEGLPAAPESADALIRKARVLADVEKIGHLTNVGEDKETAKKRAVALEDLTGLLAESEALRTLKRQALVSAGMELVDDDSCPLCDAEWEQDALLRHLSAKLDNARQASDLLFRLKTNLNHIIGELDATAAVLERINAACVKMELHAQTSPIEVHKGKLEAASLALKKFVAATTEIGTAKEALELRWWTLPTDARDSVDTLGATVAKLPDISEEDKARDFLTVAEERYRRAVEERVVFETAQRQSDTASRILEIYGLQRDVILETLYKEVADDFAEYYRSLNREDEGEFVAKLIPSSAKLGFDVDFYGYGKFPPGAYHSEGHQDGMGLCLYLALMKRTLGDKYTFSVLDDVLMSVDADHRRQVCKLLKREFPNTQFILTTHDRVWLKFMHTEGLIKAGQTFSSWSVESGPQVWQHRDVWDEIESALQKDDVEGAAVLLRRFLEYIATILADSLRAEVRFKGDGQYDLGDLMPPVLNRWQKKISDAVKAARSWDKGDEAARLSEVLVATKDARQRTQTEQWAINPVVHFNAWANLQAGEFRSVVKAFYDALATMRCDNCGGYAELEPRHAQAETIRCSCGSFFVNLKKKSA